MDPKTSPLSNAVSVPLQIFDELNRRFWASLWRSQHSYDLKEGAGGSTRTTNIPMRLECRTSPQAAKASVYEDRFGTTLTHQLPFCFRGSLYLLRASSNGVVRLLSEREQPLFDSSQTRSHHDPTVDASMKHALHTLLGIRDGLAYEECRPSKLLGLTWCRKQSL